MLGEIEHILRYFLRRDILEILFLVSYLVRVPQCYAQKSLAARLKRNYVLARGEHNLSEGNHTLLLDCVPDDSECLLSHLAIRHDVIRSI